MAPVERRVDADDGKAYTWEEFSEYYRGKYKKKAIEAYWGECKVKKGKGKKEEPKAKAKGKAKAKAKVKAAAKGKAKAKGKASSPKGKAKAKAKVKASKPRAPAKSFKVCVCGGAGGIGQPLSMLMAMDSSVRELSIFDLNIAMVPAAGVAADLNHIERKAAVKGYSMEVGKNAIDHMKDCLSGCDLVLIPAGMPRKPGQTRDDLFKVNADIAKGLVEACAAFCPEAILALIVNPVNSIVPAMAELYKKKGLDNKKIIGVTTLDCVRANKFVGELTGKNPSFINVPVVGGHAGVTILPLFSQCRDAKGIEAEKIPDLDKHVQDAGTDVVNAKGGKGSATLSMAYSGARFGRSILAGLQGKRRVECAYVASDLYEDFPYFTSKVVFGEKGVTKVLPLGDMNDHEKTRLEEAKAQLKSEIETGLKYAESNTLADAPSA